MRPSCSAACRNQMLLYQPALPSPLSEGPRSNEMPRVSAPAPKVSAMRDASPKPEEAPSTSTRLGPLKGPAALTLAICCCTAARQPMGWQLRATQPWIWG
ncbi:hypothetical protein D3C78_468020 [compost metagenome]